MTDDSMAAGRVLAGRYRLEHQLGGGGMGAIWRAEHMVLCAPVAVKLLDPEIAKDEEAIARFNREAQAAAALRSPHVVQIIDYGLEEGAPFIVMELLEGETLAERIKSAQRLSPAETSRIITHVARAVGRAHEAGVVHRDLKPENVFLVHNEDAEIAKVLDFGVAKVDVGKLGGSNMTRTGSLLGTPYYMSPEQAQGNKEVDQRSDLWALGVIAYECLTGERPFDSDALGDLVLAICVRDIPVPSSVVNVPAAFDAWFAKAVSRDPDARFQSARELADALRESLGVEARETIDTLSDAAPSLAPPPPKPQPSLPDTPTPREESVAKTMLAPAAEGAAKPAKKEGGASPVVWVAGGALLLGLVGGMVVLAASNNSPSPQERPLPVAVPAAPTPASPNAARHAATAHHAQTHGPVEHDTDKPEHDAGKPDATARDAAAEAAVAAATHDAGKPDAARPKLDAAAPEPIASEPAPPLPIELPAEPAPSAKP